MGLDIAARREVQQMIQSSLQGERSRPTSQGLTRGGTVQSYDAATNTAIVLIDGDAVASQIVNAMPIVLSNGTRVSVLFQEPHGSQINGVYGYTPTILPGVIVDYGGTVAPSGWLLCNGEAVSREAYADLFAVIGVLYGAGDSSTTFNVPDFRGRSSVGAGQGASLTNRAVGALGGEEAHVLTQDELAGHAHALTVTQFSTNPTHTHGGVGGIAEGPNPSGGAASPVPNTLGFGSDAAHNTMHPFLVASRIIRT